MADIPSEPSTSVALNTFYYQGFQGKRTKAFSEYVGFTGFGFGNWLKGFGEDLQKLNPDNWELKKADGTPRDTVRFTWLAQAPFRYAAFAIKVPLKAAMYLAAGMLKFGLQTIRFVVGGIFKDLLWGGGKQLFGSNKTGTERLKGLGKIVLGLGIIVGAVFGGIAAAPVIAGAAKAVAGYSAVHGIGSSIAAGAQAMATGASTFFANYAGAYAAGGIIGLGKALGIASVAVASYVAVTVALGSLIRLTPLRYVFYAPTWLLGKGGQLLGERAERLGQNIRIKNIAGDKSSQNAAVTQQTQQTQLSSLSPAASGSPLASSNVNANTPSGAALLPGFASSAEGLQGKGRGLTVAEAENIKKAVDPSYHKAISVTKTGTFNFHGRDDRIVGDAALAVKKAAPQIEIVLNATSEQAAIKKMAAMQPEVLSQLDVIEIGSSPPRKKIVRDTQEFTEFQKAVAAQSKALQATPGTPSPKATPAVDSHKRKLS